MFEETRRCRLTISGDGEVSYESIMVLIIAYTRAGRLHMRPNVEIPDLLLRTFCQPLATSTYKGVDRLTYLEPDAHYHVTSRYHPRLTGAPHSAAAERCRRLVRPVEYYPHEPVPSYTGVRCQSSPAPANRWPERRPRLPHHRGHQVIHIASTPQKASHSGRS